MTTDPRVFWQLGLVIAGLGIVALWAPSLEKDRLGGTVGIAGGLLMVLGAVLQYLGDRRREAAAREQPAERTPDDPGA